jgi:putative membrane-bound dehydrogenase-like protein
MWLLLPAFPAWATAGGPAADPRPPREALAAFALADPALEITLVASEPDVESPVAIAWDEDGRLYVAEMIDYPAAAPSGRIRRLEDRDGDGRYEHATVFVGGLPFPNGVLPCAGGVLVTAAPDVWFFRDRDGDGQADQRHVVLTGFGEGNTQLRVNGLSWGLDNWIYAANGRSDGEVRAPGDRLTNAVSIRRRDVRFRIALRKAAGSLDRVPVATEIEAIAGFSQFGLAHDDWGNRFPSWNTVPLRHVVVEQQSLDRNPYLAETSSVASILDLADGGRLFTISPPQARFNRESVAFFNASCGPVIERGGLLPAAYRGNAFVCEPLTNLVHRRALEPDALTFVARRVEQGREFLASSDPAFRPVNLATGPDGALYIVDMYRELVEHPEFVPEPARQSVDFRRWYNRGRIWRVAPKVAAAVSRRPRLSEASPRELAGLLGHPNAWWRATAQRLLVERADPASVAPLLAALAAVSQPVGRLHALWTLAGLDALDGAIVNRMAVDPHPGLREHALRLAAAVERHGRKRLLSTDRLASMAGDPAIRVRLQVVLALGDRCQANPAALDAMARVAARDAANPWIRLAITSGLAESALAFIPLCDRVDSDQARANLLARAAAIVGVRRQGPELATALEMIAHRAVSRHHALPGHDSPIDALSLLAGLAEGLERSGAALASLGAPADPELKSRLERLAPLWTLASKLTVSSEPVGVRLVAVELLARGRPELAEAIIPDLLAATEPPEIQAAAARAVARVGRPSLSALVLDRWDQLSLPTRRALLAAMSASPASAEPLIRALEQRVVTPGELDAATRQGLAHLADPSLRERASSVLAKFAPQSRASVLARLEPALRLAGDPRRGEALFARNCQTCHRHGGQGYRVGPDLSGIAGRGPEALLSDILDPNREVAPDYVVLAAATRRGQVLSGLLAEETATTIKLRRAEGIEETLLRSEIDQLRSTGASLMPEGLEQTLRPQELADLIAFLRRGG